MNLLRISPKRIVNLDLLVEAKRVGDDVELKFAAPSCRVLTEDGPGDPEPHTVLVKAKFGASAVWDYIERASAFVGTDFPGGAQ